MVTQPTLTIGSPEIGLIVISSVIILYFTGGKIWQHFVQKN